MAKHTRSAADDSADELNREEAEALAAPLGGPAGDPLPEPEHRPEQQADPVEAAPPADVVDSFFSQFQAEEVKLTDACKSWIRRELELFGLGHSAQDRAEMNP